MINSRDQQIADTVMVTTLEAVVDEFKQQGLALVPIEMLEELIMEVKFAILDANSGL